MIVWGLLAWSALGAVVYAGVRFGSRWRKWCNCRCAFVVTNMDYGSFGFGWIDCGHKREKSKNQISRLSSALAIQHQTGIRFWSRIHYNIFIETSFSPFTVYSNRSNDNNIKELETSVSMTWRELWINRVLIGRGHLPSDKGRSASKPHS